MANTRIGQRQREVLELLASEAKEGRSPVDVGKRVTGWDRGIDPAWARACEALRDRELVESTVVGARVVFSITDSGRSALAWS